MSYDCTYVGPQLSAVDVNFSHSMPIITITMVRMMHTYNCHKTVLLLLQSGQVCSAHLTILDLDTDEVPVNRTLEGNDITIVGNTTFLTIEVMANRNYNITVTANNSAGSATMAHPETLSESIATMYIASYIMFAL